MTPTERLTVAVRLVRVLALLFARVRVRAVIVAGVVAKKKAD